MAGWGNMVELVNRTSKPLNVRWDGRDVTLVPNYRADGTEIEEARGQNMVPPHIVFYAKNQNIRMGTEDPIDPSLDAAEVLVGVRNPRKQVDAISYLEQSQDPSRVNLSNYLGDPNLKVHIGRGPHKMSEAAVPTSLGQGGSILAQAQ